MSAANTAPAVANKGFDLKRSLLETIVAGLLALIVFGPVVGVVLDGYTFNAQPTRVAWLVGGVMVGRFVLSLFLQTATGLRMLQGFDSGGSGVHVLAPDYKSRLRYIIPALIVIAIVFPVFANKYLLTVVILGLIYVLLGLGLNIVVGLAGLLDLGYVAFYAMGAYTYALLAEYAGFGFWTALPIAGLMSDDPAETVAARADRMVAAMAECGCTLNNAYMQHSLLALVVIPEIRISDLGIVDVTRFEITDLFE
jgi:branched-chain amino acid transport system permease protein